MSRYYPRPGDTYQPTTDRTWLRNAKCAGESLELFYGPDGERQPERDIRETKAKEICAACPVRDLCLDDALIPGSTRQHGVRGGMTAEERIAERRNRGRRKDSYGRAA